MRHPAGQHEDTQYVDTRRILAIAGGILGLVLVTLGVMWLLLGRLERWQARTRPPEHALVESSGRRVPPAPRLQAEPLADLETLRAREDAQLHGWGWADQAAGRARIPIERAMALLLERERRARGEGGR